MRAWTLFGRLAALLLVVATSGGMVATPVLAGSVSPTTGRISFYGDIGGVIGIGNQSPLVVRPSTLLLAEDGSVALVHLRWSGWGTSVARATGVWSASDCTPSCATGKLTTSPARLTLSSPGDVVGHRVYRCFEIDPPHPRRDIGDHECIERQGSYYAYVSAPGAAAAAPTPPALVAGSLVDAGDHYALATSRAGDFQ